MAFWSDPFIEALEATAKLLYVYLFTCQHTNNLGLLEITRKKIAFETGIPEESVNRHIEAFEASGKVVTDGAFIWLVTFIKNQCTTSPKLVSSLQGMIPSVSSIKIRNEILRYYPRLLSTPIKSNETQYPLPLPHAIDTLSILSGEQEREEEREKERKEKRRKRVGNRLSASSSMFDHSPCMSGIRQGVSGGSDGTLWRSGSQSHSEASA